MFPISEIDLKFNEIIFSCQQTNVEIRQCHAGGGTFARIFKKKWFISVSFQSMHLRTYFSQVNATNERIRFYRTTK